MFDNLSDKLDKALHILKGHGKITEVNVAETLKEVRRALLDADVNFKIAKDFTTKVKEKAIGQNVLTTLQPGQLLVKLVKDELTELMGGDVAGITLSGNPSVILMSGLQGSGKTTFVNQLMGESKRTVPTIGLNVKSYQQGKVSMKMWDIGGQFQYRSYWSDYAKLCDVIVFIVDASNVRKRI